MRRYDLTPLLRSTIGFDRMARMLETSLPTEDVGYPPYNIEKLDENAYRVTMAVAGFAEDELDITVHDQSLTVRAQARDETAEGEGETRIFLHRGIARRAFERRFQLADHVRVEGATLDNGLLHIDLQRVIPEALKPRQIAIHRADKARQVNTLESSEAEKKAA